MAIPPTQVKIKFKNGKSQLMLYSNVDRINYTMKELIAGANRDVGKFIVALIRKQVRARSRFLKNARYASQRFQYWCRKKENDLVIGVENTKRGAESAWWADQSELGTNGQPKLNLIYNTVRDHISEIRDIQAVYIASIEDEQRALKLAQEAEQIPDTADEMDGE